MTVITQVNNNNSGTINERKSKQHLPNVLSLSLRGNRIDIARDTMLSLPESILIIMFPNGYVLDEETSSFCIVDFNIECLNYILDSFEKVGKGSKRCNEFEEDAYLAYAVASGIPLNPLLTKQAIVVLREELEFFLVVTSTHMLPCFKQKTSDLLVQQDLIFFETLLNTEEDHLIDLLCQSGFSKSDRWVHRATEPNKTCISSLSLICLDEKNKLNCGQKLMIFWKKPAKKCWWSKSMVTIDNESINLWSRRTWTLELSLL